MHIGISNSQNEYGKQLKFGGTCIIDNDQISVAISEERLTRIKYCGGYNESLAYCLNWLGATESDIKQISTSSCCDYKAETRHFNHQGATLHANNHHFSHALSSYFCSSFEEAIVVTMDGGGNTLAKTTCGEWWKYPREQMSIYHAKGNQIKLIKRYFDKPYEVGYGEAFRYVTKFLGFGTTENAGKVMALAGLYDDKKNQSINIFDSKTHFINNPLNPIRALTEFIDANKLFVKQRLEGEQIKEEHIYFANLLQNSFQNHLVRVLDGIIKSTGVNDVCFAGGVALNCTANTFVLNHPTVNRLYIHPASNDSGQCIGNAIYSYLQDNPKDMRFDMNNCYLGKSHKISRNDILDLCVNEYPNLKLLDTNKEETNEIVAKLLAEHVVVGIYSGRSEFGPRALGNRSVLGNPSSLNVKQFINQDVKCREPFMPLAASIMEEFVAEYFEGEVSKFMLLAPSVKSLMRAKVAAIVHKDGSCRAQSVGKLDNPYFYKLIQSFYKITNIPMLLNTSMNARGEPIVETLQDALRWFNLSPLKYLVINDFLVSKQD